jgi:hypothetical protein
MWGWAASDASGGAVHRRAVTRLVEDLTNGIGPDIIQLFGERNLG